MEKFDFLGQPINLYHKNSDTLKTSFGGVMTILSFIIMGLVIFAFGQDFFNRTNPKVIFSTETLDEYELHQINNRNFSIAFRIENAFGNIYNDDRNIFVIERYVY